MRIIIVPIQSCFVFEPESAVPSAEPPMITGSSRFGDAAAESYMIEFGLKPREQCSGSSTSPPPMYPVVLRAAPQKSPASQGRSLRIYILDGEGDRGLEPWVTLRC